MQSQTEEELDLALLPLGAAFDTVGVKAGQIAGKTTDKAPLLHHFIFRTRVRQIARVAQRHQNVEGVAPHLDFYRPIGVSRNIFEGRIDDGAHLGGVPAGIFHSLACFSKKVSKDAAVAGVESVPRRN